MLTQSEELNLMKMPEDGAELWRESQIAIGRSLGLKKGSHVTKIRKRIKDCR